MLLPSTPEGIDSYKFFKVFSCNSGHRLNKYVQIVPYCIAATINLEAFSTIYPTNFQYGSIPATVVAIACDGIVHHDRSIHFSSGNKNPVMGAHSLLKCSFNQGTFS